MSITASTSHGGSHAGATARRVAGRPYLGVLIAMSIVLVVVAAALIARVWVVATPERWIDFDHFHAAAQAMAAGTDPYSSGIGGYIYPPLIAWMFQVFAPLSSESAGRLYGILNVLLLAGISFLCVRECARRLRVPTDPVTVLAAIAFALGANADQVRWEIELGQTDVIVCACFVLALRWLDRRPTCAGAALGLALNIKYLSIILLPYLIVRGRWRAAGATVGFAVLFALLPATSMGWSENARGLGVALAGIAHLIGLPVEGARANILPLEEMRSISLGSGVARWIPRLTGVPPTTSQLVGSLLILATGTLAIAWRFFARARTPLFRSRWGALEGTPAREPLVLLEWCGLIVAALVFSPQTLTRHTFLLLPVHITCALLFMAPRAGVSRAMPLLALIACGLGLHLPLGEPGYEKSLGAWRYWSGSSWCMLAMMLALTWVILKTSQALADGRPLGDRPIGYPRHTIDPADPVAAPDTRPA